LKSGSSITQLQITQLPIFLMDLSKIPSGIVSQITAAVEDYILASRERYLPAAAAPLAEQLAALRAFFPAEVLESARILVLRGKRIQDPSFYSMAKMMGIRNLPSFADVAAVTFVDVIVSHEEFTPSLLFHELVHAVQYAQLGPKRFATLYVNGFIKGASYDEIPLEKNAYELESRFSEGTNGSFSVSDEVRSWIDAGKF
jgi:hypothetical protein